jgi:hypothetical protein
VFDSSVFSVLSCSKFSSYFYADEFARSVSSIEAGFPLKIGQHVLVDPAKNMNRRKQSERRKVIAQSLTPLFPQFSPVPSHRLNLQPVKFARSVSSSEAVFPLKIGQHVRAVFKKIGGLSRQKYEQEETEGTEKGNCSEFDSSVFSVLSCSKSST